MYSSFKKHQLITESWRKFIKEEQEISSDKALDLVQQTLQDNPGVARQIQKINPSELESILNAIAAAPAEELAQISEGYGGQHDITPEEAKKGINFIQDYMIPVIPASMAFMTVLNFLTIASQAGDIGEVSTGVKLLASAITGIGVDKLMSIAMEIAKPPVPAPALARKTIRR